MRLRGRVDANQTKIVHALRQVGASVRSVANVGRGVPDLLVGFRGKNFLLEVKDGAKSPSQRKLTEDEQIFIDSWKGQVAVVNSEDEALRAIGAIN